MSEIRDPALTEYLKYRVREMVRAGAKLVHIEHENGLSKGYLSIILGGTSGAGTRTATRMAKVLGFKDYVEVIVAAHDWWQEHGKASYEKIHEPEMHMDPERARAVRGARAMNVPEGAISATLEQFAGIEGKDFGWWIARISEHVQAIDHATAGTTRAEKKAHVAERRKRREIRVASEAVRAAKSTETHDKTQEHRVIRKKANG